METIIAGRLQSQSQVQQAREQLFLRGFSPEKVTSFYVNPPGQHAAYPIGGDRYRSPGFERTGSEKIAQAIEDVLESFIGAERPHGVSHNEDVEKKRTPTSSDAHLVMQRKAGMLVAVEAVNESDKEAAMAILEKLGASDIEEAEGEIIEGEWRDFDPLSEPHYILH